MRPQDVWRRLDTEMAFVTVTIKKKLTHELQSNILS